MNWLATAISAESGQRAPGSVEKRASEGPIEEYLKMMVEMLKSNGRQLLKGYAYSTPYEYFLENGKRYESSPLTPEQLNMLKREISEHHLKYKPKQCYYNTQSIAQGNSRCKYVEGYMMSADIPMAIEHAWISLEGKVVDFTMFHANGGKPIIGIIPNGWEYFGVELPTSMVRSLWIRTRTATPLVTNYAEAYPLLKKRPNPKKVDKKDEQNFDQSVKENSQPEGQDEAIIL